MKKVLIVFLIWVVTILLVNKLSVSFIPDRASYELPANINIPFRFTLLPLLNFDGRNYLGIATKGYYINSLGQDLRAFFPLFPILIWFCFNFLKFNPVLTGLFISFVSAFFSCLLLYNLVKKEFSEKIAFRSLLLFLAFPTSFFLLCYYSESLFLFLVLLTYWWLPEKHLLKTSFAAAFASATRFFGIILTPVLLLEAYKRIKKNKRFPFSVFIAPLGFVIYFVYSVLKKGDPLSFISSYTGFGRVVSILGPVDIFIKSIRNVIQGPQSGYDSPFVYPVIVIEFLSLVFITFLVIYSYKKIKLSYWLYLAFSFFIILFISYASSLPRYLLTIFPIYIFLGSRLKGWKYFTVMGVSFCLMIFLASIFLRGYWVG